METIELAALDRALLRRNSVTIKIEVLSPFTRGTALRAITVSKEPSDQFMIDTTLYEFRRSPEAKTFTGTRQERDAKLDELGCPANSVHWTKNTGRNNGRD